MSVFDAIGSVRGEGATQGSQASSDGILVQEAAEGHVILVGAGAQAGSGGAIGGGGRAPTAFPVQAGLGLAAETRVASFGAVAQKRLDATFKKNSDVLQARSPSRAPAPLPPSLPPFLSLLSSTPCLPVSASVSVSVSVSGVRVRVRVCASLKPRAWCRRRKRPSTSGTLS